MTPPILGLALTWLWRIIVFALGVLAAELVKRGFRVVRRNRTLRKQFGGPPSASLLLGNLAESSWKKQRHRAILDWDRKYSVDGIYHIRVAWVDALVISNPAVAAEVLHNRELDKIWEVYQSVSKMMSSGGWPDLVSGLTDDNWRLFRKGLAPAFNPCNIRAGFKHTVSAGAELMDVLRALPSGESIDMDQAFLCETMDVISRFAFGADFGAVRRFGQGGMADLMEIMKAAELEVERRVSDPLREWTWWMTAEGRAAFRHFGRFQAVMRDILSDLRQRLGSDPPDSDTSLGAHLLRLRDPKTGFPLPDERLLPHIGMFFFAGHDTTGHTMAWTLYSISQHPEVEARIVAELESAGLLETKDNPEPRPLQPDDLGTLTYLTAAIKESMRLNAVVGTVTIRTNKKDMTLAGRYHIPAGTGLWTALYTIHRSADNWADPDEYLPDRWLEPHADYMPSSSGGGTAAGAGGGDKVDGGSSKAATYEMNISRVHDSTKAKRFIPFSDGRRDCIGQALAKMNYTSVLAMLLSRFHFELAPEMGGVEGVEAAEHMAMTLQPGNGLRFTCRRRAEM